MLKIGDEFYCFPKFKHILEHTILSAILLSSEK